MKVIKEADIIKLVRDMCIEANKFLPSDLEEIINKSPNVETNPMGKAILCDICRNLNAARELNIPICQDTGMAVIFAEIGNEVFIDGDFEAAVNKGVSLGYTEGLLRCSVVSDPLERVNTNDNTPAIIHVKLTKGDKLKLTVAPKGFGSENMSAVKMFTPSATEDDIVDFVVDTVIKAGSNPCPPIVLGVGIGGDFEYAAILAKKALCRDVSERNKKERYRLMEEKILKKVNETDIGPQGFGGVTTALAVNIEEYPTHIAGLPVAVNVGCHVTRHITKVM